MPPDADDAIANWHDPKAWKALLALPYRHGESYIRLPGNMLAVFRGYDAKGAAWYAKQTIVQGMVMELAIVPVGPYLTGCDPEELRIGFNGRTWSIYGAGFMGKKEHPSLQAAIDEARRKDWVGVGPMKRLERRFEWLKRGIR
jgi:hypothetical protein